MSRDLLILAGIVAVYLWIAANASTQQPTAPVAPSDPETVPERDVFNIDENDSRNGGQSDNHEDQGDGKNSDDNTEGLESRIPEPWLRGTIQGPFQDSRNPVR